ncbi:glutathione S-transferase family protein [Neoroseomonas oryzicola]|uniref:Glutathione S-transferase family protein n=1 Tax=Neoroseomonas oryzicola TaxID=535904 RepID=A0A9X9WDD2_9PROT|nr:glutathione S-transferase family protein [Neoroseomonas oryzicola]MBR0658342.1 glutathione S-transferase family protein [Neoroseomonas oryzicola]NKE18507.1 glutathione S-transferase family protein [Neoroseomonas oryzicola]
MALTLLAHPFSAYCQKALVALYENATPFAFRMVNLGDAADAAALAALWPFRRFPVLQDGAAVIPEASVIIEHLDVHHPGPVRFLPEDRAAALEVRLIDRVVDNDLLAPMQKIVLDVIRPEGARDPFGVDKARATLRIAYAWLEDRLAGRDWAAGATFTLADCGAAPALLYADWAEPIPERLARLRAYRARLLARPSYARALEEARPYRHFFPLGDPGRD